MALSEPPTVNSRSLVNTGPDRVEAPRQHRKIVHLNRN